MSRFWPLPRRSSLRLPPIELEAKTARLDYVLIHYAEHMHQFIVVTPRSVRIREVKGAL
jgi:hypothetical protein